MSNAVVWEPGEKTASDENFPVASRLISKQYRGPILSYYRFARAADDVSDDGSLSEQEKIDRLNQFEDTLLGQSNAIADAIPLRDACRTYKLSTKHGQDLLIAFRMDAQKLRYADWNDLMHYCTYSAMPVGRFVLDVHGESKDTWAASDALCAALQIINHLQDCGHDYRRLDRVYLPSDVMQAHHVQIEELGASKATPGLIGAIRETNDKTKNLLSQARLSADIRNLRLSLEVSVIERLAHKLVAFLSSRDPLSEKVHIGKTGAAVTLLQAVAQTLTKRAFSKPNARRSSTRIS